MASKHLEQVQKLAEAQKACKATFGDHPFNSLQDFLAVCKPLEFPFSAIAAHLAYLERVETAAELRVFWQKIVNAGLRGVSSGSVSLATLDSAKVALDGAELALDAALASKDKANAK
jgi:hypothetical protein